MEVTISIDPEEIKQKVLEKLSDEIVRKFMARDVLGVYAKKIVNDYLTEEDEEKIRKLIYSKLHRAIEEANFKEDIIEVARKEIYNNLEIWLKDLLKEVLKEND